MGGRVATYEDSGKVFLRGRISGVRGRSYPALQELDSSPLLPSSDFRRHSEFQRLRDDFDNWLFGRLFRHGPRHSSEEIRSLGRRVAEQLHSGLFTNGDNSRVRTNSVLGCPLKWYAFDIFRAYARISG
jgi:hypothetical protein